MIFESPFELLQSFPECLQKFNKIFWATSKTEGKILLQQNLYWHLKWWAMYDELFSQTKNYDLAYSFYWLLPIRRERSANSWNIQKSFATGDRYGISYSYPEESILRNIVSSRTENYPEDL